MANDNFSMTYSLDGDSNKSMDLELHYFSMFFQPQNKSYIDGSVILPELTETSHNITVYLTCNYWFWTIQGANYGTYFDSQTVFFTIMGTTSPSLTPTLSPTPTESTTTSSTSSPSVPEFPSWIILPTLLIMMTMVAFAIRKKSIPNV